MPEGWAPKDLPLMAGKTVVISGATSGVGFETALTLSFTGARIILTGRNSAKGAKAISTIRELNPQANVEFAFMDNSSLESVTSFASSFLQSEDTLDILINNAGTFQTPEESESSDDLLDKTFVTNYLSHFLLTFKLLLPLKRSPSPVVVNVSSLTAFNARLDLEGLELGRVEDLSSPNNNVAERVYGRSKLALLLFTQELKRRSDLYHWGIKAVAATPPFCVHEVSEGYKEAAGVVKRAVMDWILIPLMSQPEEQRAWPLLFAATSPMSTSGSFYGPDYLHESDTRVVDTPLPKHATNYEDAVHLWDISKRFTSSYLKR